MSKKSVTRVLVLAVCLVMAFGLFAGCGQQGGSKGVKAGFVYIGPTGDGGWTYAHDQGRLDMCEILDLNPDEDTIFVESVLEDDKQQVVSTIENMINKGCNLIFTTSYGYMDTTLEMAEKYPNVKFMHCSGYKTADNMGNYFGRIYQARYLSGIAAGEATKTNKIGYVAAYGIPEVVRGINAFTQGVRSVNPDATVTVVWTSTWYNPTIEKEAAEGLLDAGCDVIAQHQDTTEPVKAAEADGAYSVGYHSSMKAAAPNGYLTSAMWNFGPYYAEVYKAVKDGTWKSESYWEGFSDNIVLLDEFGPSVTQETKDLIDQKMQLIKDGEWDVFYGPIKNQAGEVVVAEGEKMTDAEMLSFDWFVEGVVGQISE